MREYTYHHFRRLDIAREALDLGARRVVVQQITGLSSRELRHVFGKCPALTTNNGGRPRSVDKLFQARVMHLHASDFYNGFHHLLHRGVPPDEAMVVAYRHYQRRHPDDVRLDFDRAFSVVTAVCRLWTVTAPSLTALRCQHCGALFLAPIGAIAVAEAHCSYCSAAAPRNRRERPAQSRERQPASALTRIRFGAAPRTPAEATSAGASPLH